VAHLTSSIGWGFVAVVASIIVQAPLVALLLNRVKTSATVARETKTV
jgi:hypothetical protein